MKEKDIVVEAKALAGQNHRIYGTALSESLANLVDDLADEIERHRAIMEMRVDKETLLKYFHVENGAMDIAVNPPEFHKRQAEPSLDDSLYERIEMEFAIPVYVTQEQQRLLHELFNGILQNPANIPLDGVHWQNAHGPKPIWSEEDNKLMGKVFGSAPRSPTWDENTLYFGSTTGSEKEF